MRTGYKIVTTAKELEKVLGYIQKTGYCSLDFETSGIQVYNEDFTVTGIGLSFQPGFGYFVPLDHFESPFRKRWKKILRRIAIEVAENPAVIKIAWNLLFEFRIFLRYGFRMRGRIFDPMLAKYLLNEERPHDLKSQVAHYFPEFADYDLTNKPGKSANPEAVREFWVNVPLDELGEYCAADADFAFRLFLHYEQRLMKVGLYRLFRNLYMPLVRLIGQCIHDGVLVDEEYLGKAILDYQHNIEELEDKLRNIPIVRDYQEYYTETAIENYINSLQAEIDSGNLTDRQIDSREAKISRILAGEYSTKKEQTLAEPLNFASPTQLAGLLYSPEGFNFPILERTASGAPSTGERVLKQLAQEDDTGFLEGLLELRGLQKMYSTYLVNIYQNHIADDGKIHPTYLLHGTVTGRFSSRNPNFQNIPRSTTAAPIKRMFIAPRDHYFVEVDGSQMELRIAAEMSGDPVMVETYRQGKNIHVTTAAKLFNEDYDRINKARKDNEDPFHEEAVAKHKTAKVVNFTIFYGATKYKVQEVLFERQKVKVSVEEADQLIKQWFKAFPSIKRWMKEMREFALENGYVENLFGRRRRLPILLDPFNQVANKGSWNEALRQAINAPIQGMASDVTQWYNIQIYKAILEGKLPSYIRLVSTVHDSVEYYIHKDDVNEVLPKMIEIGTALPDMKKYLGYGFKHIEMKFSAEVGINWGEMEEFKPDIDYRKRYDQLTQS